jgi:uncharacterized protein YndB with AHSA1/START domain
LARQAMTNPPSSAPVRELTITRVLDAPRELVFRAWTDPQHLTRWWGPHGFTTPLCEADARPGGDLHVVMRAPNGVELPMSGVYHEIIPPERIVMTIRALEDADGNPRLEARHTITFDEHDGKTTLTMHAMVVKAGPAAAGALSGMERGWNQSLERLAAHVEAIG